MRKMQWQTQLSEKKSEYRYEATSFKEVQKPLENFNHIAWFPIDEAIQNLKRGSHKWAIESWKKQHKIG
nr:hypothetical protein [Streptococcus pneumoniae]